MPDKETQEPETPEPETSDDNALETKFWENFDARVDAGIERALAKYRKQAPTGTARTGRTTLPEMLANLVFGPAKGN